MLAQQQNTHAVSYSLQQQQVDSKEMNSEGEADVKTFSIRQYVFACRQKSLLQSWPFPEKYLQMCLDRGLRNVLPPFGLHNNNNNNSVSESSSHSNAIIIPNLNDPCDDQDYDDDDDDKSVKVWKSESPDHHELKKKQNIMNHSDSGFLSNDEERSIVTMMMMTRLEEEGMISAGDYVNKSSQITLKCSPKSSGGKLGRRRRKGRCKKKSMADILAEAKHCSLEEINRINQFSYAATGNIIEGYSQYETAPADIENDPKCNGRDYDHEETNFDRC